MKQVSRYHPILVILHWLLAIMIIAALVLGFFVMAPMPNADPGKIAVLRMHMAGGMLILALMVIRFLFRMMTARPPEMPAGHPLLDRMAKLSHNGFYILVPLMAGTGFATARLADLPEIVFGGSGAPLPSSFDPYPTLAAHGYLAAILAGLIVLHVLAALYHQFVRKDGLFGRMFFGRRVVEPAARVR